MSVGSIAASALNAFSIDMMVRSNNVANINTDGFKAQDVTLMTGPGGRGVQVGAITASRTPGPMVPGMVSGSENGRETLVPGFVEGSNTDLANEFVQMIASETAYAANATVVRADEEISGALLDIVA